MRKRLICAFLAIVVSGTLTGQDPAKVDPKIYRQKLANERVRVFEITFKPGQSIKIHAHPDHVVYVLTKGTLLITEEGKKPVTMNGKPGDTFFLTAQKHSAKNIGKTMFKAVVVELR
jgi:beta-alanine degradation protein BauB